ncbi:hypothetical protein PC9H_003694 [Pleurotus ostreatus]|uniref:Uncharacterized protein n=2 Tax=Pleurotus TaxID=5320 RepID=A0A8H7A2Z9_PLEOS|nr:uncharacterized protein PC9H_003694 [Pleurotus ostreatus]KAF7436861.1 hypothetical protein PC9H_003694 [Pleurotus ostreatus]KAG9222851.1 hypothetical protein CCMSSC00406_0000460 [Pleurotus cornucopiae]
MDAPNSSTSHVIHPSLPTTRSPSPDSFPTPSQLLSDIANAAPAPLPAHRPPPQNQRGQQGARKQRNRLASLGFQPTDPESISSHDRKRYYLECIESYSLYLQDRVRAAGFTPVPIQRVIPPSLHSPTASANPSLDLLMASGAGGVGPGRTDRGAAHRALCQDAGKGLSIESIRTLLVHMESTARKLNEQTLVEEQQFAKLRAQYEALHANDHSSANTLSNTPLPNDADSPYQSSISGGNGSELSETSASAGSSPNGEMSS